MGNVIKSPVKKSGGVLNKNNAAGSGNEEDLKKDPKLLLESADKLSQGSLPSTPTRSVVDTDTTTDYESADEGQASVDFGLLAHNLEQINLSTPSTQSKEYQDNPLKSAEKTVYLSSPDSDDFNVTYKTVVEKTLYKSISNFSDGSPSDENIADKSVKLTVNNSNNIEFNESFNKTLSNQIKGNSLGINDKTPEIAHDSTTCIEGNFNNVDISPIEFIEPCLTTKTNEDFLKVKFLSPLSDLDKSFSGDQISILSSDSTFDDIQLNEECSKEQSVSCNDKNDGKSSFEEVQVPLDSFDEVQVPSDNQLNDNEVDNVKINVNLSINSYFLNIGNIISENSDDKVEIASEAQEINLDTNIEHVTIEKSQSDELTSLEDIKNDEHLNEPKINLETNIEHVTIEKSQSEELTSLEDIKNDEHLNEPKSSISIDETLDLKLSENSINKNNSVSDDLQSVKNIQSDFDSLIYNEVANEIITKDNFNKKIEDNCEEGNVDIITCNNENDKLNTSNSTCLTFNIEQTSIENLNSNKIICEDKLDLDKNSEIFDIKQQTEFISNECRAVGAPVSADLETGNNLSSDINKSDNDLTVNLNTDQTLSTILSNNNNENNGILLNTSKNEQNNSLINNSKELKIEFSPLNISSASDRELQENIESCEALLLEELNDTSLDSNLFNIIVEKESIKDINISSELCESISKLNINNNPESNISNKTDDLNEINSFNKITNLNSITVLDNSEKVFEKVKESLVDNSISLVGKVLSSSRNINIEKTANTEANEVFTEREIEINKHFVKENEEKSLDQEIIVNEENDETLPKEVIKQVDLTIDNAKGIVLTNNSKIISDNQSNNSITGSISVISTERILPVQVENQNKELENFKYETVDNCLVKENDAKLCDYLNKLNISDKKNKIEQKEFNDNVDQVVIDTKTVKQEELSYNIEKLSAVDKINISEPINLSIKEHNKLTSQCQNTNEEIEKDSNVIKSHNSEDNINKGDLSSSFHESASLNSSFSKELLQSQLNRSYRDLTELIATCSKQERELAGKEVIETNEKLKVNFKEQITEINKGLPMAEDSDEHEVNQHMMQPTPSADINNSEAGPVTADEDFHKGEFFQEATAIDFSLTPARLAPSLTRKSLYIRFDPLIEAALSAESAQQESRDNNFVNCVTAEMADTKFGEGGDVEKTPKKDRNLKDSQTLIMINTPGGKTSSDLTGSEKLNNSSPSTPNNSTTKRTLGSGGTPSLRQEVSKLQDLMIEQEQAYVEQLAEKNEMIGTLRSRVSELEAKEPRGDLEEKLKSRETEAIKMRKELNENILMNKQLLTVMEEYEKAIASSVRRREDERNEFEKIKEKIAGERDTALQHLTNMEVAFNDIHLKYERCKSLIETLHNNEKQLKQTIEEQEKLIEQQKQSYAVLKQHATEKVNEANQEIAAAHKAYQAEIAKMKAMSKKAELKVKSLEESLEQKKKEVKELTQICDELIGKVSGQ